jgi:hypothetical protein
LFAAFGLACAFAFAIRPIFSAISLLFLATLLTSVTLGLLAMLLISITVGLLSALLVAVMLSRLLATGGSFAALLRRAPLLSAALLMLGRRVGLSLLMS